MTKIWNPEQKGFFAHNLSKFGVGGEFLGRNELVNIKCGAFRFFRSRAGAVVLAMNCETGNRPLRGSFPNGNQNGHTAEAAPTSVRRLTRRVIRCEGIRSGLRCGCVCGCGLPVAVVVVVVGSALSLEGFNATLQRIGSANPNR